MFLTGVKGVYSPVVEQSNADGWVLGSTPRAPLHKKLFFCHITAFWSAIWMLQCLWPVYIIIMYCIFLLWSLANTPSIK
jgi:hypothetical protein